MSVSLLAFDLAHGEGGGLSLSAMTALGMGLVLVLLLLVIFRGGRRTDEQERESADAADPGAL